MQVDFIAQATGCNHWILLVLRREILKRFVLVGVNDSSLFEPANFILFGLYPQKAASVLEHLERLTIHHLAHSVGNGCHSVMQIHLPGGDVDHFMLLFPQPVTSRCKEKHGRKHEKMRDPGSTSPT